MNKKMRELLTKIQQKRDSAKGFLDGESKDIAKAQAILDEVDEMEKEFNVEKRLFEAEKAENQPGSEELDQASIKNAIDGFTVIAKQLMKKPMDEKEKALILNGESGENFLLPEDVRLAINELRRSFISAKELVSVTPTFAVTGSFNYEAGDIRGLSQLIDGQPINQSDQPSFIRKPFTIDFFAKLIPVSNLVLGAERAGLMSYLNKWFVKNAIFSENNAIFNTLRENKTVKNIKGWEALKRSINVDVDPACLIDGVIVTNQTGFAALDEEKDENGRGILTPNPANATEKLFQSLRIHVFSDAQLPNVGGLAPMFYGSLKAGCEFVDYMRLEFATSSDFLFNLNQTAIRVIEGFDVIQADADAYVYATFAPGAAAMTRTAKQPAQG